MHTPLSYSAAEIIKYPLMAHAYHTLKSYKGQFKLVLYYPLSVGHSVSAPNASVFSVVIRSAKL
jgi:hypothetical protein